MSYPFMIDGFFSFLRNSVRISRLLNQDLDGFEILIIVAFVSVFVVIICFFIYKTSQEKMYEIEELIQRQESSISLKNFDSDGYIHTSTGLINGQSNSDDLMKTLGPIQQFDLQDGITFYRTVNMVEFNNSYFECTVGLNNDRLEIFTLKFNINSLFDEFGNVSMDDMLLSLRARMVSLYEHLTKDINEESDIKYFKIAGRCICKLILDDKKMPLIFFRFSINN